MTVSTDLAGVCENGVEAALAGLRRGAALGRPRYVAAQLAAQQQVHQAALQRTGSFSCQRCMASNDPVASCRVQRSLPIRCSTSTRSLQTLLQHCGTANK
jgi:hypothetical protein